jgi:hypothetical protein
MIFRMIAFYVTARLLWYFFCLAIVLSPMLLAASIWGADARLNSVSQSWQLLLLIALSCLASFAAGASVIYIPKITSMSEVRDD